MTGWTIDAKLPSWGLDMGATSPGSRSLIFLNGTCGVGKTSIGWALLDLIYASVLLDGDHFAAVNPFSLRDRRRELAVYETLGVIIRHHEARGFRHFIVPYVFAGRQAYEEAIAPVKELGLTTCKLRLHASAEETRRRIIARNSVDCSWELKRALEIQSAFETAGDPDEVVIDTTGCSIGEVVYRVQRRLFERLTPNDGPGTGGREAP